MTKSNSHAKALSAEILQNLSLLLAESARADDNLPGKLCEESLYESLDKLKDEIVASMPAEDIAEDVLKVLTDKSTIAKLVLEIIEDYVDGAEAHEAYQEHIKSGEKFISLEELARKCGLD